MTERPWWCQDPACRPDANTGVAPHVVSPGDSGWCCGQLPEPVSVTRHGVEHVNDGHYCFRSPVRGVVMLEIREGDLDLIAQVAMRGLVARGRGYFNVPWYAGIPNERPQT